VAEGGQDPLPRPRQRRQDHAPAHAQGRGRGKITSFFFLPLCFQLLVCANSSGDGWIELDGWVAMSAHGKKDVYFELKGRCSVGISSAVSI